MQTWHRVSEETALLIKIHKKYPKLAKSAKRIMSRKDTAATRKGGRRFIAKMENLKKEISRTKSAFGKYLSPRKKELDDSINILKTIAKADFPKIYSKLWRKKK